MIQYVDIFSYRIQPRIIHFSISILLAILWLFFASKHIDAYRTSGMLAFLAICISESFQAFFFLIRQEPSDVSREPIAWFAASCATFFPFLLRPGGGVLFEYANIILICGVVIQVLALFSLNRSFSIIPANRHIKTKGMYAFVRHPMYFSYLIIFIGYLLFNATLMNLEIVLSTFMFLFLRINEEEKLLLKDRSYQAYTQRVKWRVIPFVY